VDPVTGRAAVIFPINHPGNRVELRDPGGVLLGWVILDQCE
jgi:hypothetical protein